MDANDNRRPMVVYIRVSTDGQFKSGLGLEAQAKAVEDYIQRNDGREIGRFVENETGKKNNRPQLAEAIALCKATKALLVIAKLDRLARKVSFIANLMEGDIEFVACDMPTANRLTVHIMAAFAEEEARAISKRTKEALAAAKARGQVLGSPRPGSKQANEAWSNLARQHRETVYPLANKLKGQGKTLREVALELNERNVKTINNGNWHPQSVKRLLDSAGAAA